MSRLPTRNYGRFRIIATGHHKVVGMKTQILGRLRRGREKKKGRHRMREVREID